VSFYYYKSTPSNVSSENEHGGNSPLGIELLQAEGEYYWRDVDLHRGMKTAGNSTH
jgi:hypothetical protein